MVDEEQNTSSFTRRIPPTRSADDLIDIDSSRKAYSGNMQGPRQISSLQTIDAPRSSTFVGRGVIDAPRSSTYITKATIPPEVMKSVVRYPPTSY
ncbi:hypothetical protein QJS04_geneDACA016646 [Acorus gramineus]|uniref:Uncharacterized protein n=1 Tax=Acorus gramineus TaxID=55184 RepID=A0AAV9ASB9_ACOGR|nr:hypothetical protein QJS04_geneDACA016646 [Acorus gramineus]